MVHLKHANYYIEDVYGQTATSTVYSIHILSLVNSDTDHCPILLHWQFLMHLNEKSGENQVSAEHDSTQTISATII